MEFTVLRQKKEEAAWHIKWQNSPEQDHIVTKVKKVW
jgi:hypothetical protein